MSTYSIVGMAGMAGGVRRGATFRGGGPTGGEGGRRSDGSDSFARRSSGRDGAAGGRISDVGSSRTINGPAGPWPEIADRPTKKVMVAPRATPKSSHRTRVPILADRTRRYVLTLNGSNRGALHSPQSGRS